MAWDGDNFVAGVLMLWERAILPHVPSVLQYFCLKN